MKICICFCKNCGANYHWQASGDYKLDTPEEYNDHEYCPKCKKAIVKALKKISKKTELRYVDTDDYTLAELLQIQEDQANEETKKIEEQGYNHDFPNGFLGLLPMCRRIFPSTVKSDFSDSTRTEQIKINKTNYRFSYWSGSKKVIRISKEVRWDLINESEYK